MAEEEQAELISYTLSGLDMQCGDTFWVRPSECRCHCCYFCYKMKKRMRGCIVNGVCLEHGNKGVNRAYSMTFKELLKCSFCLKPLEDKSLKTEDLIAMSLTEPMNCSDRCGFLDEPLEGVHLCCVFCNNYIIDDPYRCNHPDIQHRGCDKLKKCKTRTGVLRKFKTCPSRVLEDLYG